MKNELHVIDNPTSSRRQNSNYKPVVIGDSMVRNVTLEMAATMNKDNPRTRARDIESCWIMLSEDKHKYTTTVTNIGSGH